jgi:hypothetical protein
VTQGRREGEATFPRKLTVGPDILTIFAGSISSTFSEGGLDPFAAVPAAQMRLT